MTNGGGNHADLTWRLFINEQAREFLDFKTGGFFLKISKEIGKAWRKSLTCEKRASVRRP